MLALPGDRGALTTTGARAARRVMHMMTIQEYYEQTGFIVLSYDDPKELERDDTAGYVTGEIIGLPEFPRGAPIIGPATATEWDHQCCSIGDNPNPGPAPKRLIGYRKVIAE